MDTNITKVISVLLGIFVFYWLIVFTFYLVQNKFLFWPKKLPETASRINTDKNIQNISIKIGDSMYLHGWLCKKPLHEKQKLIIYFGGNGDEVSSIIPQANLIIDWAILLVNYPGYGSSDGTPNENSFFDSALKIYDQIISNDDIDKNNIVIMGRSIGTGVASFLASKRKNIGVILISPFASMVEVVNEKFAHLIPINLILKSKFESKIFAKNISSPLLCIYGTNDRVVPMKNSLELMKFWGGKVESKKFIGLNHDNLIESKEVWDCVNEFLSGLNITAN